MRFHILLLPAIIMLTPSITRGENVGSDGFEMWEDHLGEPAHSTPGPSLSAQHARSEVVGQPTNSPVPPEQVQKSSEDEYIIFFGAGASWALPYRISDGVHSHKVLSEFSVSWAPFGILGEIGLDLLMNRNNTFLVRPNLKFFFVKRKVFSFYLEGSNAILVTPGETYVGGGSGLGMIFGLMDHLSLELRAAAVVLDLPDQALTQFAGTSPAGDSVADPNSLVIIPSVGARLMARF